MMRRHNCLCCADDRQNTYRRAARGITAAQGGDQFLDGIGETGLVARYVLNANAEDSSRNQFHATLRGNGGTSSRTSSSAGRCC